MPSPSVIMDPTSDTGYVELARFSRLYEFPDFVKRAALEETTRPGAYAALTTYADPVRRLYPCHTAAATWLSSVYFHEKKAEYHTKDRNRVQQRLEQFVDYYRIRPAYDDLVKQASARQGDNDLPDSAYAYVWVDPRNQHKERHLPLNSALRVKEAAEWLRTYRDSLPYVDRRTVAFKILEKRASTGAALSEDLQEFLEKQAGRGVCDPQQTYLAIMQRATLCNNPVHRDEIVKLAEMVRTKPRFALAPDQLVKLAETLDEIDRALRISYSDVIQRPEDVVFSATFTKAASEHQQLCPLTTGNVYRKEHLEKVSREDLAALFGDDFVQEVSTGLSIDPEKLASVATTLPRPDAHLFDQMMQELGLPPVLSKASSDRLGLSREKLEKLASAY